MSPTSSGQTGHLWISLRFPTWSRPCSYLWRKDAPGNLAITDIKLRPASPAAGETVEVACSVANYSAAAQRVPVALQMGDGEPLEQDLQVDPGMTATASFRVAFDRSGFFEGSATIGDDALREDNTRHVVVHVSDRFPITILTDAPADARGASHRFLTAALDPFGDETSVFVPEVMPPDAFDRFAAGRSHAVIVTQAAALGATAAAFLVDYLNGGGRVIYFVEGPADRNNLALLQEKAGGAIKLPIHAAGLRGRGGVLVRHPRFRELRRSHAQEVPGLERPRRAVFLQLLRHTPGRGPGPGAPEIRQRAHRPG